MKEVFFVDVTDLTEEQREKFLNSLQKKLEESEDEAKEFPES